jgi:hypothetical protein
MDTEEGWMSEPNQRTCAFPGCEVEIGPSPEHGGPAPGYCDDPDHNAHSVYWALKRGEGHASPDTAARLDLPAFQKGSSDG